MGQNSPPQFLFGEWTDVVDAWQLTSWDAYAQVCRLGRKTRIGGKQREALWGIFEGVQTALAKRKSVTWSGIFGPLTEDLAAGAKSPSDFVVIGEAQDLGIAEARFFSAVGAARPKALFFAGDLGQRIFQQPFSRKALGIDVRGRSYPLRINYRTSHQIRSHAEGLLPNAIGDVDGNAESRRGTVSVFDGPPPSVQVCASADAEQKAVAAWIAARAGEGYRPEEIGVFVRSDAQLERARAAVTAAGASSVELTDQIEPTGGHLGTSTMHLAKGLEFPAVAVMACDDEVLPLQERIEAFADDADLEEVYNTERHLLYVACTRARDNLLVTGITPGSEFLADIKIQRSPVLTRDRARPIANSRGQAGKPVRVADGKSPPGDGRQLNRHVCRSPKQAILAGISGELRTTKPAPRYPAMSIQGHRKSLDRPSLRAF